MDKSEPSSISASNPLNKAGEDWNPDSKEVGGTSDEEGVEQVAYSDDKKPKDPRRKANIISRLLFM